MQLDHTPSPSFPENLDDYAPWVAKHGLAAPYGECQCGCGQKTTVSKETHNKFGWRKGEPLRFVIGHVHKGKSVRSVRRRFWKYVTKTDSCWLWNGCTNESGYGLMSIESKAVAAHRISYELHYGPIPEGEGYHGTCVLHKCDTPSCCNPEHLFLGTQADNIHDMISKKRDDNRLRRKKVRP